MATMKIGARIAHRREQRGWSQTELASRLGVTVSAVSLWEAGRTMPRRDRVAEIAKVLGCNVKLLIAGMFA
jgi:transcriptional regulator with XRE-family HTH domain